MKRITSVIAVIICVLAVFAFSSCGGNKNNSQIPDTNGQENQENIQTPENSEPVIVNVASLKGPTSIGLVKVMEDESTASENDNFIFDFNIEAAADAISPRLIKGELDIAAVPANLAAVLYNKTEGNIVALNINTLGVLYIVENGNKVNTIDDLKGMTIYASGKGNTPEYALNFMLTSHGIIPGKDVVVEYKSEHAECVSAILSDENSVAMLPQPFVTTAQMQNENIRIALDLNKEWESASGKTLVTGVTVARKDFVEQNPEAVKEFLNSYKNSVEYVNANVEDAAKLVEKFDIFKAAVAQKAIPYCQISFITGDDMKTKLGAYLEVLNSQNPSSIGGNMPGDDFYYYEK